MSDQHPPCPKCGQQPEVVRVGAGYYWLAKCPTRHLYQVEGHTMKTKRAALEQWDIIVGATLGRASAKDTP